MKPEFLAGLLIATLAPTVLAAAPQATRSGDGLVWAYETAHGDAVLRVMDDAGTLHQFALGAQLRWSPRAAGLPDGSYRYELTIAPPGAPVDRRQTPNAKERPGGALASGHFVLRGGALAPPQVEVAAAKGGTAPVRVKDQVVPENLVVQGRTAIGFDALNDANFGVMTMFVAENNLRLHFEDTSAPEEPDSDWEITANDSASGGLSYFTFLQRDVQNRPVLRMLAGAPGGSFWVDGEGRLALNSAGVAQQKLHITSGDGPGVRLDQDNSGGFSPSTFDIVADETGLRISDALVGTTPFAIATGAPTGTLTLHEAWRVGIGTPEPQTTLHVRRSDGSARTRVEETDAVAEPRVLAQLLNQGVPGLLLQGDAAGWRLQGDTAFTVATMAPAAGALQLATNGDLSISGTLSQGSSRTLKHAIEAAAPAALLDQVRALPVYAWQYTGDALGARHLGPMAEDVHAAFGFGGSERALAPGDVAGIAMAAAQALREELAARDAELEALVARLELLEAAGGAQ